MNRDIKDWKCPDCDMINIGRRCVICGTEKPQEKRVLKGKEKGLPQKQEKPAKKALIFGCGIALFIAVSFLIAKIAIDYRATSNTIEVSESKEKGEEEEKEVFIKDTVYKNKFSVSVDKHSMDKHPDYDRREEGKVWYSVPMNFKNTEGDTYFAYDKTAYLRFFTKKVGDDKNASSLMEDEKLRFGDGVTYEKSEYNQYELRAETGKIKYFLCEKIQMGEAIGIIFVYPKEYADIYDDYLDELYKNLNFPIDVIEI